MTRYLGIDYGRKRIGLAVGDDDTGVAAPLETIQAVGATRAHAEAVQARAADFDIDAYVVGLPLNMDGTEGSQVAVTRSFGERLAVITGRPVYYFDERLSSRAADELLKPAELTPRSARSRRDAVSAQVILQGFLDARSEGQTGPRSGR